MYSLGIVIGGPTAAGKSELAFEVQKKIPSFIVNADSMQVYDKLNKLTNTPTKKEISVGTGFDVHGFETGKHIIICGVKIPFSKKLKGHSDADVGFHTIVDAILGSVRAGDIGDHFPPSDKKWKDAPSSTFIKFAKNMVKKRNGKSPIFRCCFSKK